MASKHLANHARVSATRSPLTAGQGLGNGELWANWCELIGFGRKQDFPLEVKVDIARVL